MRFFALDLHISVIADLKDILKDHEVVEWSLSGHNWVFGRNPTTPEIIHQGTWQSPSIRQFDEFRKRQDSFLRTFDGFLVGHVTAQALLFEPQGKSIQSWNTCRWDLPMCFRRDLEFRDIVSRGLQRMTSNGQLRMVSNNRADQEQLRLTTDIQVERVPSLCRYTGMKANPTRDTFLWYSEPRWMPQTPLLTPRPQRFEWSDLATYRGIVHLPQEISTMSLQEHYQSGIPLFVPTKRFLKQLWSQGAHWQSISAQWGPLPPRPEFSNPDFWLDRADFQDPDNMRSVQTQDNFEDLLHQLANFTDPHRDERQTFIRERESRVVQYWQDVLKQSK